MKKYSTLVNRTQDALNALNVDTKAYMVKCDETGQYWLTCDLKLRMSLKFLGMDEVDTRNGDHSQEVYRGNVDSCFELFMMWFSPGRLAHMRATDEEVIAFTGHPDEFPAA